MTTQDIHFIRCALVLAWFRGWSSHSTTQMTADVESVMKGLEKELYKKEVTK